MAKQTVTWTVLPNGVSNGRLHLSIFVTPRLEVEPGDEAKLVTFPDWHDWPAHAVTFDVIVGDQRLAARTETRSGQTPRSDLWRKLFVPARTPVAVGPGPEAALLADKLVIRSVPTQDVRRFVRTEYAALAAHFAVDKPRLTDFRPPPPPDNEQVGEEEYEPRLDKIALPEHLKRSALAVIDHKLSEQGYFVGGSIHVPEGEGHGPFDLDADGVAMLLAERFQLRPTNGPRAVAGDPPCTPDPEPRRTEPKRQVAPLPEAEQQEIDFHQAVGAIGEYPAALRLLGLVRDISIPLPAGLPLDKVSVRVEPKWQSTMPAADVTPGTSCSITATTFDAVPAEGSIVQNGMLQLQRPEFDLLGVDAESASMDVLNFAAAVDRADESPTGGRKPIAPPALYSRGFSLNHTGRAEHMHGRVTKGAALEASMRTNSLADVSLTADDLMRGVRIDVWDDVANEWRSLCERKGAYTFTGTTVTAEDEGTVVPAAAQQLQDPDLYLHESLIRWSGYSLVAPRPGRAVSDTGELIGGDSEPGEVYDLKAVFRARPGSLPKLRYGRSYRMRARVSDLAGNGLGRDDVPESSPAVTDAVPHLRFEPVASPVVVLRAPATEGETPEQLVIRGNYDKPTTGSTERHLLPDKVSMQLAEEHGKFDVRPNPLEPGGMSKAAYLTLKEREPGSLANSGKPDPRRPDQRFYDTDHLQVPYLPDVLARGVAFVGLPGVAAGAVHTEDYREDLLHKWPNVQPFRVQIVEGTGAPEFSSSGRVLRVQVPKGRVYRIRYSTRINEADRELLGTWRWLVDYLADPANPRPAGVTVEKLRALATKGQLWQLTPDRTLTLVNAVRQPLNAPAVGKPVAVRRIGETSAKIVDKVVIDRKSTNKLDLLATWTEPVDLKDEPGPRERPGSAVAYSLNVDPEEDASDTIPIDDRHEFHDTKHRRVTYEVVATSRYAHYFTERRTLKLAKDKPTLVSEKGIVPGTDAVTKSPKSFVRDKDYRVDLAKGTVTALVDELNGVSVEVAFVAPPITRSSTEVKPAVEVTVPSSARPSAPDIAYIVPTFGWERAEEPTSVSSKRHGNGLRVYLRRPWYSSGEGEQLGVVLSTRNETPSERMTQYVSTWGQDPAFSSPKTSATPLTGDFPAAIGPKAKLKLAESDRDASLTDTVSVAPHDVGYDEDRQLYYSDILFRPGQSYMPFVRLALARFQRSSVSDVELSSVALAQFAQLSPERALSVVTNASDATLVNVTVTGPTYAAVDGYANPSAITVRVQRKIDPSLEGDLAWTNVDEVTLASTSPGTWTGSLRLPAPRGSEPFRLVVREIENPPSPNQVAGKRLVYVDTVSL